MLDDLMSSDTEKAQEREEEALARKHEEEVLDRKAKAGIHADACTTPLKMVRGHMRRKLLINQVICGRIFKTNRDTKLCFKCEKKR